jgi:hypothetical protein
MRHPDSDKIVVARNDASGAWVYFSVRDDRDNGTIIDFLQNRGGGSLGEVRKTLRAWLGSSRPPVEPALFIRDLAPVSRDRAVVVAAWERARACTALPYLTSRGLGPDVLALPRFEGCVRVDQRNNALFPSVHFSSYRAPKAGTRQNKMPQDGRSLRDLGKPLGREPKKPGKER